MALTLNEFPTLYQLPADRLLGASRTVVGESILRRAVEFRLDARNLLITSQPDLMIRSWRVLVTYGDVEVGIQIPWQIIQDEEWRVVEGVIIRGFAQLRDILDSRKIDRISERIEVKEIITKEKIRVIRMKGRRNGNTFGVEAGRIPGSPVFRS